MAGARVDDESERSLTVYLDRYDHASDMIECRRTGKQIVVLRFGRGRDSGAVACRGRRLYGGRCHRDGQHSSRAGDQGRLQEASRMPADSHAVTLPRSAPKKSPADNTATLFLSDRYIERQAQTVCGTVDRIGAMPHI